MAALGSSVTSRGLALHTSVCVVFLHRRHGNPVIPAAPSRPQRSLASGLTTSSSGMNNAFPIIKGTTRIPAVGPGPANPPGGNLPIPSSMPPWAKWVAGAVILAIPIYRRFRTLEEKTAEVAIEVVDTVAEAAEKVAGEVAGAFPGNDGLREAASKIKTVADEIEEDAEKAEALIEKVDEIKKEVDSIVDPIIDKVVKDKEI
ncbi:uncharacterized protein [Zea mays]|uniref:Uncharacterized protein n=1 Tax=Zea mays TaxID=4577 RepID=A0A804RJV7_MAIZE|nr:uncharacterized protein LOC103641709 isoform X2 [Zea mays]|eukprot:XP_008663248.1 uncharacterized protein LOC103641709 isoform X2 [Zea mays]